MPKLLTVLSVVGVAAMLWVGGHIILNGLYEDPINWAWPHDQIHHLEEAVHHATGALGGVLAWFTGTLIAGIFGLAVGAVVVAVMHVLPVGKKDHGAPAH